MVFTKLLLENALTIRPCNCEAASEPLLPKVARCIPVLPSRYIAKGAARVLKCSAEFLLQTCSSRALFSEVFLMPNDLNRPFTFAQEHCPLVWPNLVRIHCIWDLMLTVESPWKKIHDYFI